MVKCDWCGEERGSVSPVVLTKKAVEWASTGTVGSTVQACDRCKKEIESGKFGSLP